MSPVPEGGYCFPSCFAVMHLREEQVPVVVRLHEAQKETGLHDDPFSQT